MNWDKDSSIPSPEWVSPWQIELAVSPPPINPLPVPRPKTLRPNALASFPGLLAPSEEDLSLSLLIDVELVG